MVVEKKGEKYFYKGTEDETFPFLPNSRQAKGRDFIVYMNGHKRFKLGVEFYALNSSGFFDKYTTSENTDLEYLDLAIKSSLIYII